MIKYYSEMVLVETITRKRSEVQVTFSAKGTKNIPMQEIFKALDGIPLKVDMKPGEQLTVEFYLKPGMEDYEWLQHILKFVKNLYTYTEENKDEKDSWAEGVEAEVDTKSE